MRAARFVRVAADASHLEAFHELPDDLDPGRVVVHLWRVDDDAIDRGTGGVECGAVAGVMEGLREGGHLLAVARGDGRMEDDREIDSCRGLDGKGLSLRLQIAEPSHDAWAAATVLDDVDQIVDLGLYQRPWLLTVGRSRVPIERIRSGSSVRRFQACLHA